MIQKTTNYDLFKTVHGNRELNPHHLAQLALSIAKKNLLEFAPIMVNENMEVIDGQHRLEVARQNSLPIYYTVVNDAGLDEVIELNTTLRNWKLTDFVDSMIVQGNKTMQYLREFCDEYRFSLTTGIQLHQPGLAGGKSYSSKALLERLQFTDMQRDIAVRSADLMFVIREFTNRKGALPRSVVKATRRIAEEKLDKKVADAIQARGKMVAIVMDTDRMYEILKGYVK